jgi:Domain of unknown function (DUF6431)
MIVVIPQSDLLCNSNGEPDWEWLPRICPACGEQAIIGHGRRRKQAHAERHTWIRIRRGFCKHCKATCTLMPAWSLPYTHYSVQTRRRSSERYCAGAPIEHALKRLASAVRFRPFQTSGKIREQLNGCCCPLPIHSCHQIPHRPARSDHETSVEDRWIEDLGIFVVMMCLRADKAN